MTDVPAEVADRIRRLAPVEHAVVEGSLPVVSFGDYRTAAAATLALNPSPLEFLDKRGGYLIGGQPPIGVAGQLAGVGR